MDELTRQRLAKAAKRLSSQTSPHVAPIVTPVKPGRAKKIYFIAGAFIFLAAIAVFFLANRKTPSPSRPSAVPATIRRHAKFAIFYPEASKLPNGYILDAHSFSGNDQAVVYSVTYNTDQKIAFTVQKKPSEDELKAFYANQIPIRNEAKVPAGTAAIGVLNNQTFVSLPTESDAWLLITAPKDIDQNNLKRVLQVIRTD
ncbi:MAG TPA: hypothetical protein VF733_06165 [Candidatus Saccharimonadales bacterium]